MAEKEYIDRAALQEIVYTRLKALEELYGAYYAYGRGYEECTERISEMPTADVAPVVHAEWEWHTEVHGNPIDGMDEDFGYRCSNCKVWAEEYGVDGDIYEEPPTRLNYCPHCGARMDGGKHE